LRSGLEVGFCYFGVMKITQVAGDNVRFIREKRGLTQEELAIIAKMSKTFVGDIERGSKAPTITSLAKLAKALKVSPADLLTPNAYKTDE
jgi:transcriptional regulator with XRE-family HTH domain